MIRQGNETHERYTDTASSAMRLVVKRCTAMSRERSARAQCCVSQDPMNRIRKRGEVSLPVPGDRPVLQQLGKAAGSGRCNRDATCHRVQN